MNLHCKITDYTISGGNIQGSGGDDDESIEAVETTNGSDIFEMDCPVNNTR
ncbi:MAG: hypothetical protein ACI4TW_00425 [Prevotella sp.]